MLSLMPVWGRVHMRALSQTTREQIVRELRTGVESISQMENEGLASRRTIERIRVQEGFPPLRSQRGRPRLLSDRDERHLVRLVTRGDTPSATMATFQLARDAGLAVHPNTVRRALTRQGLKAIVKPKKPRLTATHRRKRLEFARKYKEWSLDDWKRVVWSDETKVNVHGSDGQRWAYKRANGRHEDHPCETVKFGGGSLMFWGCMGWQGIGYGSRIEGRMDASLYVEILEDELQASIELMELEDGNFVFQQDNDPKHRSRLARDWFKNHNYEVMDWPSQSPDLNPIEHLWGHLKRQVHSYETPAKGVTELWDRVQIEWEKIPKEVCQNLIASMPSRIRAVLKANGGHTKY
jgi:transposase